MHIYMCVCVCVYIYIYYRYITKRTSSRASRSRWTRSPKLAASLIYVHAYICIYICACVCASISVYMSSIDI